MKNIFNERTTSSFGLSIGTSLTMESIFGIDNKSYDATRIFTRVDVSKYEFYYINVLTLLRNIYTSVNSSELSKVIDKSEHKKYVLDILFNEFEILNRLFDGHECKIAYFLPDYSSVSDKTFLRVNSKVPMKDIIHTTSLTLYRDISNELEELNVNVLEDTHKLDKSSKKTLITTHIAVDLLNYKYVRELDLLESHTGVLKTKKEFNCRYPKSKVYDRDRLPFNEVLLRLLGDNLVLPKPLVNYRSSIGEISKLFNWTPLTTETKVIENLKSNKDIRNDINVILQYSKSYR